MNQSKISFGSKSFRKIRSTQTYGNYLIAIRLKNIPLKTVEKQDFIYINS